MKLTKISETKAVITTADGRAIYLKRVQPNFRDFYREYREDGCGVFVSAVMAFACIMGGTRLWEKSDD